MLELGDVQGARARLERALKILERDVGDNYLTSAALINLGLLHLRTGEWRAAETYLERALRIEEQIGGTKSAGLRWPLNGLGMVKLRLGDLDEADRLLTRARRIQEETLGPRHPAVANNIANLASVAEARGELDEAERLLREARSLLSEDVGSRLDLAAIDNLLVSYELERGSCEGLETLETGRALIVEARGESHEEVALLDRTISRCHLVRGEFDEAVTAARRAYDAMKRIPDVGDRAGVAFTLAKALEARNGEHDRADSRKVALSALESFESRSEFYGEEIDEVQAWLAR